MKTKIEKELDKVLAQTMDAKTKKAMDFLAIKKDCSACEFERKEYGAMYCTDCYNAGGKEVDEILAKCEPAHNSALEIVNCEHCTRAIHLLSATDGE
jgi:hypothetical protein